MTFVPGLALSRAFFREAVEPALGKIAPKLRLAAALIGDGSEVLGYDDAVSADHDWGPRLQLFVREADFAAVAEPILAGLAAALPPSFAGWPVRFPDPDRADGVDAAAGTGGSEAHGVEVYTVSGWSWRQLGADFTRRDPSAEEWLALDEQLLLSATAGAVFRDDLGELEALRRRLECFPRRVRLTKMAALWAAYSEEAAFVGRTGHAGDELGSHLIAARQAERLIRLCFLTDRRYAPYSKWLGTAWRASPSYAEVGPPLARSLAARRWRSREAGLNQAALAIARRQLEVELPGAVTPRVERYYERPYKVINAAAIAAALRNAAAQA